MRPIDADELVDALAEQAKNMAEVAANAAGQAVDYYSGMKLGYANAALIANVAPTIDAVPAVRCKDYKYYREGMNNADKFKSAFGLYATEVWSMPEKEFNEWLYQEDDGHTIEPVKHGKWKLLPSEVVSDDGLCGETRYVCSNCGKLRHFPYPYCPICGAKMERSEDG